MLLRLVRESDLNSWLVMRSNLWPHCPNDEHLLEMTQFLNDLDNYPVYVLEDKNQLVGFIEASIHTYAPGCHTTPVGYIEGWYVLPEYRRSGVGRKLIEAVEKWAMLRGFREVCSDAETDNVISICAHQKIGYKLVGYSEDEAKFLKELNLQEVFCNSPMSHVQYKHRQCAYGIILKDEEIAIVKLTKGLYLPGGGMEKLENFEECIKRELLEEIGYDCEVLDLICKSKEYYYATHTKDYRVSEGYFYSVLLKERISEPIEKNHQLIWVNIDDAIYHLVPMFQREALKYFKKIKMKIKR